MKGYQFKNINHTPLWNIQKEDDEYLPITLPVALFGMIAQFFFNIILVMAWFSHEIVIRVEQQPTMLNSYLQNVILLIPVSFLSSFAVILLFSFFSGTFSQYNFITQYRNQLNILNETFTLNPENMRDHKSAKRSLLEELSVVFILGLVAGFYYSLLYFILYLILYFFLIFLLINITSFSASVTISMLFAWVLVSIYLVSKKLVVEEIKTRNLDPQADYGITKRNVEIITSNQPPIICNGCRSYIVATSIICKVCGDPVENEDKE